MSPLLSVQELTITFEGRPPVVKGLSFDLFPNETLGIIGASGSGKSLSALALMGLLPQNPAPKVSGKALFNGKDLLNIDREALRQLRSTALSMVFQDSQASLNPIMTVGKQLVEGIRLQLALSKKEAKGRAEELLASVGMAGMMNKYPFELSGGMRQRIIIAIAISCTPSLLIADEATTALDSDTEKKICALLQSLKEERKMSMIFITHDLPLAATLCNRIAVMASGGKLVEIGTPEELFNHPKHPFTKHLVERANTFTTLEVTSYG